MRKWFLAALATLAVTFVGANVLAQTSGSEDKKFESLGKTFIEELLKENPEWATELGDHRFDNRLNDYSLAGVERDKKFAEKYLKELARINPNKLSQVNNIDYRILKSRLEYQLFSIETLREYEWNPLGYNPGRAIYALVARDFAPLRVRLTNLKGRLAAVPTVLNAARANLKSAPRVHTETAITQNAGNIALVSTELDGFIKQEPDMQRELAPLQAAAKKAFEDYGAWLKNDLLPRSTRDFRIGEAKFDAKLKFALDSDLTKEEIMRRAIADLKATQDEMYEVALPMYRKFYPNDTDEAKLADRRTLIKAVLDKLAETRPNNETIVARANESLRKTTDFVRANNIVTVPDDAVKIIVMPEFARGTSVAYCDPAGAFEKRGETFYAISPTPKDWTSQRVESFYKEYNDYMIEDLTVHEAMPGHYLQLAHANRFKAPTMLRALYFSGTFVEGWAVYSEAVMAEKGYGGAEVKMQQLKMKLRLIINAMLDQRVHAGQMSEREAMELMMREGFQEEGEAAGKWRRAQLSSSQLSTYYVGSLEVGDIRRDYQKKMGDKFDMKKAHDTMLSFGSPSAKYVRELMGL